jgi:hypothetical protein
MATKKSSKRPAAKKSSKKAARKSGGKASVAKGRKFEDDVAGLYKLQGAEVVQNIELHNKKVDILATFSYPIRTRVIVECKDEKRAVDANTRVMEFYGLLTDARAANTADAVEIITRVPWGDAAKGFAHRTGIGLYTYTEKISRLIDFTRYLEGLIRKYEERDDARPSEPPLGKYYVDLSAARSVKGEAESLPVIDVYIKQWLQTNETQRHLAIFGEYGAGKSSLCQKIARDLAVSFLSDPNSSRIPILLNLREFVGKLDLDAYITSFLDRECKVYNPKIDLFKAMNDAGTFLLIFDGLDEMAVKVDADTLETNLMEIERLAASPNSKVILTSRPEFFISTREELEVISPTLNPLLARKAKYEPLKILPWDESQVEQFLQKRVPLVERVTQPWTFFRDQIRSIGNLSDLSQRPVLLDMIAKTLPTLIADKTPINRPNLYRTYLIGEIRRQKVLKKRELLIPTEDRLAMLQKLAVAVNDGTIAAINFTDTRDLIEREIKPPKHELEAHTRDFLTNSFLARKGDEYHFSHKSIQEYLVAAQFYAEMTEDRPLSFGRAPLQSVIREFLLEFKLNKDILYKWLDDSRGKSLGEVKYLGGNSATLLCRRSHDALAGRNLANVNLTGISLISADLRGSNLKGALLTNVDLYRAKFGSNELEGANLQHTHVTFYFITELPDNYVGKHKALRRNERFIGGMPLLYLRTRTRGIRAKLETMASGIQAIAGNKILGRMGVYIDGFDDLERKRKIASDDLSTTVAVFFDEYEQLIAAHPEFR